MTRRFLLTAAGTWLLPPDATQAPASGEIPLTRLGIVTDVHYADKQTAGTREYRGSFAKLTEAIEQWDRQQVDAVIELGDLVDASPTVEREMEDLQRVRSVLRKLKVPQYFVLGNHCVDTLTKPQFLDAWGAEKTCYSFVGKSYRGIVLDSAFSSDGQPYGGRAFDWKDAFVPPAQLEWLGAELETGAFPAVVFIHHRLDTGDHYSVSNAAAVRAVLEASGRVLAVFQGHQHVNDHRHIGGIHYCSLKAMVDGPPPESSAYGILDFYSGGRLFLTGYRLLSSRELPSGAG
ncbi:MAG: metallophosphoesterase [Bryobacterales bacterium]|nr:metallophosphoesterase [Bryobacterales bacterium]